MRHKTWVLLFVVAVAVLMVATPLSAKEPLRGDQVMVLNQDMDGNFGAFGCPDISWFGEIEIDETTYGMALYPLPGKGFTGQGLVLHYTEAWRIFDGQFAFDDSLQIEACEPGSVLLAGTDSGVGVMSNGKFRSTGVVEEAYAPFQEWIHRTVFQDGMMAMVDFGGASSLPGFYGDLRLN